MTFALEIAARTVWQEARGEPEEGQRAVAHVIVNRMHSRRWGNSLASVCLWDRQFSGWNSGDPNRIAACVLSDDSPVLIKFRDFISKAMSGEADPTGGATHYFNPKLADPPWAKDQPYKEIGNHRFLKNIK